MNTNKTVREIKQIYTGTPTSDGDGVSLTRVIGSPQLNMLDPFLLLDEFGSDRPLDYIGGFPAHPHRGFETVTYMLAGKMRHKDSAGNSGVIEAGGVQWMTAGRGIIHSEMPEQTDGLLAGLQLWVNLPASKKMSKPKYQEYIAKEIPTEVLGEDGFINVIAGETKNGTLGVIENELIDPSYWDVTLNDRTVFEEKIKLGYNAFIYMLDGKISIGNQEKSLTKGQLAVLNDGEDLRITSKSSSRFVVIAGKPLNEPVSRGGPFVMNTKQQILDAFADYKNGQLTE
jgi:redox-sensitive bicupin YhaK (pirin superfamily)